METSTRIAAGVVFACMSSAAYAGSPDSIGRRNFLDQQSGRIAVYPSAKEREDVMRTIKFFYFPQNGEYELHADHSLLWFGVDHQLKPDIEQGKTGFNPTFLAVQIIAEYSNPPSATVYMYRNGREDKEVWVRDDDPQFDGTDPWKLVPDRPIAEFFKSHTDPATSEEFDTNFGKWHAQPAKNEDSTWKFRNNWIVSNLPDSGNVLLENYLYRFTPTRDASNGPLPFYTNVRNVQRMRIRTFAPSFKPGLFDNDIIINFK